MQGRFRLSLPSHVFGRTKSHKNKNKVVYNNVSQNCNKIKKSKRKKITQPIRISLNSRIDGVFL